MNKNQKSQLDAFNAFKNYCNSNSIVWQLVVAFATSLTALGVKIQSLLNQQFQQDKDTKGVTIGKREMKSMMANMAASIAGAIQAYASIKNLHDLFDEMAISYSDIYSKPDSEAISNSQGVLDKVTSLTVAVLKPYGVSDTVVQSLHDLVQTYSSKVSTSTKEVKTNRKNYSHNIDVLIGEANTIMRKQLLKMALQWKTTNTDFYNGLVSSARIDRSVMHTRLSITVADEATGEMIPKCTILIDGTELKGITNKNGKCTISSVPMGEHDVTVMCDKYTTMHYDKVNFIRGKSTRMEALLTKAFDLTENKTEKVA